MGNYKGVGRGHGHPLRGLMDTKALAEAVSQTRKGRGLSLRDVADETNISQSTLSRIERCQGASIDTDNLILLCEWLGVPKNRFLHEGSNADVEAICIMPSEPTPSIVQEILRKDQLLTDEARRILANIFHTAYKGFVNVDKQHGHKGYQEDSKKTGSAASRAASRKV
jgi:transcriptional regulator with XRE-family HTH domain